MLGLTKVLATDLFQDVSDELLRVAGEDAGLLEPVGVAGVKLDLRKIYIYMTARPVTIYAGANEVQRNIVANMLMGPGAK